MMVESNISDIHAGHRKRLKERYLKQGLDGFEPHNVLELLLFYSVPRMDTNEIAHRLLTHFGSLAGVFEAEKEELLKVKGVGESSALLLTMIPQLSRLYREDKIDPGTVLDNTEKLGNFLLPKFVGKKTENIYLICLDGKRKKLYSEFIAQGSFNTAPIYVRNIIEIVVRVNADAVVLAHNHPNGLALPSNNDMVATKTVYTALKSANVCLYDHIVVADEDFVSMRDSGALTEQWMDTV